MAGKNLFADDPTIEPNDSVGVNLFADTPNEPQQAPLQPVQAQANEPVPLPEQLQPPQTAEQEQNQLFKEQAKDQSLIDSLLVSAGRGLTTVGRGVGLVEPEDKLEKQAFSALKEERPVSTFAGEVIGESAPFLVPGLGIGAIASTPARILATTALGATESGVITSGAGGQEIDIIQASGIGGVVAGTLDLVLPRISRLGGALVRRVLGKSPKGALVTPDGVPTPELQNALDQSGLSFEDLTSQAQKEIQDLPVGSSPEQTARVAAFKTVSPELNPTKAQITRDATDFQAQQESFKVSGVTRDAIEEQERVLSNRFNQLISETDGVPVNSNSPVFDAITNKSITLDNEIGALYRQARELAPDAKNVHFGSVVKVLKETQSTKSIDNGLWDAVRAELRAKKIIDKKGKIIGTVDVETAENVRKFINQLHTSTNGVGRTTSHVLKNAIDDDVFRVSGDDIFKAGRQAKRRFEQGLSKAKINKFDKNTKSLVRDILENKIDPDQLVDKTVFSKGVRASELQQVKDFLATGTPDQISAGNQAWNDLRAETLQKMKEIAFTGGDDKAITRASLERALNRVGKDKLRVLFKPKELKFLEDLKLVTELREPKRGTFTGEGPSAQAIKNLSKRLEDLPAIGAFIKNFTVDRQGRVVINPAPSIAKPQPKIINQLSPAAGVSGAAVVTNENEK